MLHRLILLPLLICLAAPAWSADTGRSGLPLPRFVILKADEVNVRSGPGTRYPIQWVYRKEGLPVEVVEEFDHWRKIRDSEGTTGWVHKNMLDGRRNAIIKGKDARIVRSDADGEARAVMKVAPKVQCKLLECTKEWCRIEAGDRKGWIRKDALWGVYPAEVFE